MNENQAEGAVNVITGKLESAVGEALGDGAMRARGGVRQVGGHVQEAAGSVQETLEQAAAQAKAAASMAGDAYARASRGARAVARTVEDEPYLAVAVGVAIGLLAGLLIAERRPKVIYVKPRN